MEVYKGQADKRDHINLGRLQKKIFCTVLSRGIFRSAEGKISGTEARKNVSGGV